MGKFAFKPYNRNNGGSGRGGDGRDGGDKPNRRHCPEFNGRLDRYCVHCGEIVEKCAIEKPGKLFFS